MEGLERVIEQSREFRLVGSAGEPAAALETINAISPDVVLLDEVPGWRSVLHFLGELKRHCPEAQAVLWVSEMPDADCYRALQLGARGVFRKTLPTAALMECLRVVSSGRVWMEESGDAPLPQEGFRSSTPRLTPRERQIVRLVARGLKNREIADELAITAGTVKVHLMHVFEKTGVKDRFQLSVRARSLLGEDRVTVTAAGGNGGG
ncbi:MAG: response regulator transcription factor [bacterium]|nr:response regulator transcription factor [bacterium]